MLELGKKPMKAHLLVVLILTLTACIETADGRLSLSTAGTDSSSNCDIATPYAWGNTNYVNGQNTIHFDCTDMTYDNGPPLSGSATYPISVMASVKCNPKSENLGTERRYALLFHQHLNAVFWEKKTQFAKVTLDSNEHSIRLTGGKYVNLGPNARQVNFNVFIELSQFPIEQIEEAVSMLSDPWISTEHLSELPTDNLNGQALNSLRHLLCNPANVVFLRSETRSKLNSMFMTFDSSLPDECDMVFSDTGFFHTR